MLRPQEGRLTFVVGSLFLASMVLGSCSGANHCAREQAQTEESLKTAREAEADLFSPSSLKKAARLAEEAGEECRLQQERFPLARSFHQAEKLHRLARQAANKAREEAELAQGLIKQEALNRRLEATEAVSRARGAVTRAQRKIGAEDMADLRGDLAQLDRDREEMQKMLDEGEYLLSSRVAVRILEGAVRVEASANRRRMGSEER